MKMRKIWKSILSCVLTILLLPQFMPVGAYAAANNSSVDDVSLAATLTFSDSGITETVSGSGYSINGTTLTINEAGVYRITGFCSDGSIEVAKSLRDVTLVLDALTLTSMTTGAAPVIVKKGSDVDLVFINTSTLTDSESDTTSESYEGAAIKVKSGASLTLKGATSDGNYLDSDGKATSTAYSAGILNLVGTDKNGIKGAATSTVTMYSGTVNITAANNGLAADGSVIVSGGTLNITAGNEGIKSEPDEGDTDSAGTIDITGGTITIDTQTNSGGDGIQAASGITISGGTFDINSFNDGIQSNEDLTISGGTFDIMTYCGYSYGSAVEIADISAKGLKASASDDDTDDATNAITISGGTFSLNCADDAVHSDGTITVTGGTFTIDTGDDGMHADTTLNIGTNGGKIRDPHITINNSYEGLEAGTVNILGGKIYVVSSDDGINAAGGSSNGTPGGKDDHFNPGHPGGGFPGGDSGGDPGSSTSVNSYAVNISGGKLYVNADGDGLDSNGNLTLSGGEVEVWGQTTGGDNDPLDCDGTLTIGSDVIVFAAGSTRGVDYRNVAREYSSSIKTASISVNSTVTITGESTTKYQTTAPKAVGYILYNGVTSFSVSTGGSVNCKYTHDCSGAHSWFDSISDNIVTCTCSNCSETETQTITPIWKDTTYVYAFKERASASSSDVTLSSIEISTEPTRTVYYIGDQTLEPDGLVITATYSDDSTEAITYSSANSGSFCFSGFSTDSTGYKIITLTYGGKTTFFAVNVFELSGLSDYVVTLSGTNCTFNVFYTQDTTSVSEAGVTTAYPRDGNTGNIDVSGDGQVNFTVVPSVGYTISDVSADGSFKNLKTIDSESCLYRLTKVSGTAAVFATVVEESEQPPVIIDTAGWKKNATGWWYQNADGTYPKNAWQKIDGKWYHFDAKGYMQTGWLKLNTTWYYLGADGIMITGWKKIGSSWYYFNSNGSMAHDTWKDDYYLTSSGKMATDTWIGDKYVNSSGKYDPTKEKEGVWKQNATGWWYQNADGTYPKSCWKKIDGKWYYFNDKGYRYENKWLKLSGKWYYFQSDGVMATGWLKIGSYYYYFNSNGSMASDTWIGNYYVDANGRWIKDAVK